MSKWPAQAPHAAPQHGHRIVSALARVAIWIVAVLFFLRYVTLALSNSLALQPNWFYGDKNDCGNGCDLAVGYSSYGFPIEIDGSSVTGHYTLAWTINYAFAAICAAGLAWLLFKKPRAGLAVAGLFIGYFMVTAVLGFF
jgi:hypothetical protein